MPNLKLLVDKDNRNHVIDADRVIRSRYLMTDDTEGYPLVEIILSTEHSGLTCFDIQFDSQDAANLELSKLVIQ